MANKIINAQIVESTLGLLQHDTDVLTCELKISCCELCGFLKFGGIPFGDIDQEIEDPIGIETIRLILNTLDVQRWENLKNSYIRIEFNDDTKQIIRLGHILKDKWISNGIMMKEKQNKEG